MAILEANNNGGRYNMVHRQTDDGLVISVAMGNSLMPLVFRYKNYLGCDEESLLSSAFYPHKHLMRGDCGWEEFSRRDDLLFSWKKKDIVIDGFSNELTGEFAPTWHETYEVASDVLLCGLTNELIGQKRLDREYWTPDTTLQATSEPEMFGFEQWNPLSCPPKQPNKCGIVTLEDEC